MNKHNFINVWMFKGFLLLRESEQINVFLSHLLFGSSDFAHI